MVTAAKASLHSLLGIRCTVKVVDIGASPIDGKPLYLPLMLSGCAEIVGFEPSAEPLGQLNARKGAYETYLPYAVGDGKKHILHLCRASGMTSLFEPDEKMLSLFNGFSLWGEVVERLEIDTVRLDDIPETASLDYLKLDIQGAELMVFENATERLKDALVIQAEVGFLALYKDQPLFSDVDLFMRRKGYMLHTLEDINHRALAPVIVRNSIFQGLNQILYADAVYIRDIADMSSLRSDQLLRMATILHDCYSSYDVVLHFLTEHDRRTGSTYGGKYSAFITPLVS